ncbi:MAG: ATP-binding cassette domain-containing protein [Oscillospiraceae bacterium]|nr:ATP-binding cassette domain-containing protein [Oscillospiraceae bacterium]
MIEVQNLSKNYGSREALRGISFSVEDGEILGFLGPNGAGKSTTMNIITGCITQTGGKALINGINILENPMEAKKSIGYLPEIPPVYPDMTVDEYLNFVYGLKKCKFPKNSHLEEIRTLVGIEDVRKRVIRNLSKGYKQRVGIAQALIGNPQTIVLDEPTVGLDPKQIIEIRSLIKKLGKNHTVILSSHILSEVQAVCDKIVVIDKGKLIAFDTAENLSRKLTGDRKLTVHIEGDCDKVENILKTVSGIDAFHVGRTVEGNVKEYELEARENCDIRRELFNKMAQNDCPILLMKGSELTLEEIFLKLTTGDFYGGNEQ